MMKKPSGQLTILLILGLGLEFMGEIMRRATEALLEADSFSLVPGAAGETPVEDGRGNGRSLILKRSPQ